MRINVALVQAGFATSRRSADEMIKSGQVRLNGSSVIDFSTQAKIGDTLSVNETAKTLTDKVEELILLNKPIGYTCTHKAQKGQKTIFDLLPPKYLDYKIAGRLDIDSRGLIILVSSGLLTHKIIHPSQKLLKYYVVTTKEKITTSQIARLTEPINIGGKVVQAREVVRKSPTSIHIAVSQGYNRQLRRMFGKVGLTVVDLVRIGIGVYSLDDIPEGQWQLVRV